jgi:hypothetical protein
MRSSCSLVDGGGEVRGADGQTAEIVPQRGVRGGSVTGGRAMAGYDAAGCRVLQWEWEWAAAFATFGLQLPTGRRQPETYIQYC